MYNIILSSKAGKINILKDNDGVKGLTYEDAKTLRDKLRETGDYKSVLIIPDSILPMLI